jgi:hypothetical protein
MSYIYIAYDADAMRKGKPHQAASIGAGLSLDKLLNHGIFLQDSEAHIFLCKIVKDDTQRAQVKREAFVGTFSPRTQAFKPAEVVLTHQIRQSQTA